MMASGLDFQENRWFLFNGDDPLTSCHPDAFGQAIYDEGKGWYKYVWYGIASDDGSYDFAAEGDHGHVIYVSPASELVIVRTGFEYGIPWREWLDAFHTFAGAIWGASRVATAGPSSRGSRWSRG